MCSVVGMYLSQDRRSSVKLEMNDTPSKTDGVYVKGSPSRNGFSSIMAKERKEGATVLFDNGYYYANADMLCLRLGLLEQYRIHTQ